MLLETRLEAASLGSEAAKALKAASRAGAPRALLGGRGLGGHAAEFLSSELQCRGVSSGLLVRSPSALPFQVWSAAQRI